MAVRKIIRNKGLHSDTRRGNKGKIILDLISFGVLLTFFSLTADAVNITKVTSSVNIQEFITPVVTITEKLPVVSAVPSIVPTKVLQVVPTIIVTTDPIPTPPVQVSVSPPVVTVDNSHPIKNIPTGIISTPVSVPSNSPSAGTVNPTPVTWTNTPVPSNAQGAVGGSPSQNSSNTNSQSGNVSSSPTDTREEASQQTWNINQPGTEVQSKTSTLYYTKENFKNETIPVKEVVQNENAFEVKTEANTRVFLISTTNSCHGFSSMTFKSNKEISGKIYIDEDPNLKLLQNKSANIYSACTITLDGFTNNDIQDVKLKGRYTSDWADKNSIQANDIKLFFGFEPTSSLNQKSDVSIVGTVETGGQAYNIIEASFEKIPQGFSLAQVVHEDKTEKNIPAVPGIISSKWKPFLGSVSVLVALGFIVALLNRFLIKRKYKEITDDTEKPVFW